MRHLDTTMQTIVGSTWLVARWLAFLLFGATTWWHTRPRLLLAAAALLVVTFVGVTMRPVDFFPSIQLSVDADLQLMILWQIVMGVCMGIIYSGSLYFGMVLSEGSTEHGGYHEALIGLGQTMGPLAGAIAQWIWPGSALAGIAAVSGLIALAILAATASAWRAKQAG